MSHPRSESPQSPLHDQKSVGMVNNPLYEALGQKQISVLKKEQAFSRGLRKELPPTAEKTPTPFQSSANKMAQPMASKKSSWQVLPPVPQSRNRSYTCSEVRRPASEKPQAKQAATVAERLQSSATSLSTSPPSPARPPLPAKSQKVLELQHAVKDYRESTELPAHAKHRSTEDIGQQTSVS